MAANSYKTPLHHTVSGLYMGYSMNATTLRTNELINFGEGGIITGKGKIQEMANTQLKATATRVKWVETYRGDIKLCGPIGKHERIIVTVYGTYTKSHRFRVLLSLVARHYRSCHTESEAVTLSLKKNVKDAELLDEDVCRRGKPCQIEAC